MSAERPTILVVDDELSVAQLERLRLEHAGYGVCVTDNSVAAFERAMVGDIDLAIVDLQLEENVTGLDLLQRFKTAGLTVPVIIVTG